MYTYTGGSLPPRRTSVGNIHRTTRSFVLFVTIAPPPAMASIFHSFPLLRTAAPRLSKQFFTCQARQLHHHQKPIVSATTTTAAATLRRTKSKPSWILRCHYQSTHAAPPTMTTQHFTSSVGHGVKGAVTKTSAFPKTSDKSVAYWLLGSAASVFGIVIWGGLTRLTESGYVHQPVLLYVIHDNQRTTLTIPSTTASASPNGAPSPAPSRPSPPQTGTANSPNTAPHPSSSS